MDRSLIKAYIDSQPTKAVIDIDLNTKSIKYDLITQGRSLKQTNKQRSTNRHNNKDYREVAEKTV